LRRFDSLASEPNNPTAWAVTSRSNDDLPHVSHGPLKRAQLEQRDDFSGLVHLVDGIVHRCDEILNIAPVEGGDERSSQRGQHLTGQLIGFGLALGYFLAALCHIFASCEQCPQSNSASNGHLSVANEELEEALFPGHQGTKPTSMDPPRVNVLRKN